MDSAQEDPRVSRSRTAIETAALDLFLARGYVGAGVDDIADSARVSKRTIYNIYGGKEQLFAALMARNLGMAERFARVAATVLTDTDDVEGELVEVAVRLATMVVNERVVRLRRLLIGEVERFPELADRYYRGAPATTLRALADALARLDELGKLVVDDPTTAAEHFAFLVMGAQLDRALFTAAGHLPPEDAVAESARQGAAAFVRAYRPV